LKNLSSGRLANFLPFFVKNPLTCKFFYDIIGRIRFRAKPAESGGAEADGRFKKQAGGGDPTIRRKRAQAILGPGAKLPHP